MKVNLTPKVPKFEPIEMTITFESKDELESLFARVNIYSSDIPEYAKRRGLSTSDELGDLASALHRLHIKLK